MRERSFAEVDVFSEEPYGGNPVVVVLDAEGLHGEQMQAFARKMNVSETTFVLPPTRETADYRVRIFAPGRELPFAGHPTLGTCHAWLEATEQQHLERIVQECGDRAVEIRRTAEGLAFAAPPVLRSGEVEEPLIQEIAAALDVDRNDLLDAQWVDNGPGWLAVMLPTVHQVLELAPTFIDQNIGVAALHEEGQDIALEVRAFFPRDGEMGEDPVTGSLNASLAQWLVGSGRITAPYVARQGTAIGRTGRIHISRDDAGTIWVAGAAKTCIRGVAIL